MTMEEMQQVSAWRKFGAVAAGVVTLGVVVLGIQRLGAPLTALPPGIDPLDPAHREAFEAWLSTAPLSAWIVPMASEVIGAFFGAVVAGWLGRDRRGWLPALVVGFALTGSVMNWIAFPHPAWFVVGQVVAYPLALLAAVAVVRWIPGVRRRRSRKASGG